MSKKITVPPRFSNNEKVHERREFIHGMIQRYGFWGIDKNALAERFKVHVRRIYEDIEELKSHIKPTDIQEAKVELDLANRAALNVCKRVMNNPEASAQDRVKAARALSLITEKHTRILESWGIKEPVAERHEHVLEFRESLQEIVKRVNEKKKEQK